MAGCRSKYTFHGCEQSNVIEGNIKIYRQRILPAIDRLIAFFKIKFDDVNVTGAVAMETKRYKRQDRHLVFIFVYFMMI